MGDFFGPLTELSVTAARDSYVLLSFIKRVVALFFFGVTKLQKVLCFSLSLSLSLFLLLSALFSLQHFFNLVFFVFYVSLLRVLFDLLLFVSLSLAMMIITPTTFSGS